MNIKIPPAALFLIKSIFLFAAFFFCLKYFYLHWDTITFAWEGIKIFRMIYALCFASIGFFLLPVCIWVLYRGLETTRIAEGGESFLGFHACYYIANIYKYIPGKVSTLVVILDEAGRQSLNRTFFFQAWIGSNALSILIAMALAAGVLWPSAGSQVLNIGLGAIVVSLVLAAIIPRTNRWAMQALLSPFGKKKCREEFPWPSLLKAFVVQGMAWLFLGASFACVASAYFPSLDREGFLLSILAYPVAHVAGFLALIAPAGIGVREGILTTFLLKVTTVNQSQFEMAAIPLFVVVMHRLVITVIDFLFLFIGHRLKRARRAEIGIRNR